MKPLYWIGSSKKDLNKIIERLKAAEDHATGA